MTTDFVLTLPYDRLIRGDDKMPLGIYHFHRLRADQICRLHHSMKSVKYVQERLKTLVDNGYLQQSSVPTELYRSPYHYSLSNKSVAHLKSLGWHVSESFRASKEAETSYLHIRHELELNDVIISAALLSKEAPEYRLQSFKHDRELAREAFRTMWHSERLTLIPDAFLDFRQALEGGKQRHLHVLLEHDCDTEKQWAFRRRIRAYIILLKSEAYKERFKVNAITVAFTTFTGEQRREQMREWTRLELATTNESKAIGLSFLFAHISRAVLTKPGGPACLWLQPCWYSLYEGQPLSLLLGDA